MHGIDRRVTQAVDHLVAQAQATGQVPTLVAAVIRHGAVVHLAGADEAGSDPATAAAGATTQHRIGSITKTMTATLVMQLRDAGALDLDRPLTTLLPRAAIPSTAGWESITCRHLLAHVSGLRREPDRQWWERTEGPSREELVDSLAEGPTGGPVLDLPILPIPHSRPPHPYRSPHYSNLGYGLLGMVLEQVTGRTWWELFDRRLRTSLGMERTTYLPEEPFARGYVVHPWDASLRQEPHYDSRAMAPAGQLWSTLGDLARWAGFLTGPDPSVLAPASLAEMCQPVTIDPHSWAGGQGLGLALWRDRDRIYVGHGGSMPGYLAVLLAHRDTGIAVAAFANAYTLHGTNIRRFGVRLLGTVLDGALPAPDTEHPDPQTTPWRAAGTPAPATVAQLLGSWWWMGREYRMSWDPKAAEVVLTDLTGTAETPNRFAEVGPDRWRGTAGAEHGEPMTVQRSSDGVVHALDIGRFVYTRQP